VGDLMERIKKIISCIYTGEEKEEAKAIREAVRDTNKNIHKDIHFEYIDWGDVIGIETTETEFQDTIDLEVIDVADIIIAFIGKKIHDKYLFDEIERVLELKKRRKKEGKKEKPRFLLYFKSLKLDCNNEGDCNIFLERIEYKEYLNNEYKNLNFFHYEILQDNNFEQVDRIFDDIKNGASIWFEDDIKNKKIIENAKQNISDKTNQILENKEQK